MLVRFVKFNPVFKVIIIRKAVGLTLFSVILYGTMMYPLQLLLLLQQQSEGLFLNKNLIDLTLKIPISIPYSNEMVIPQSSDGLMEKDGLFYSVASKNYKNDTLYVNYQENKSARDVFDLLADHINGELGNDQPSKKQVHFPTLKLIGIQAFRQIYYTWWLVEKPNNTIFHFVIITFAAISLQSQSPPPEEISLNLV